MSNKKIFDDLFLLSGEDLVINEFVKVKHPSVNDILNLGNKTNCDTTYSFILSDILCNPYDNMVMLYDNGLDYEEMTSFDVFVFKWQTTFKAYLEHKTEFDALNYNPLSEMAYALNFFLDNENFQLVKEEKIVENEIKYEYYLKNPYDDNYVIDKNMFNYMVEFISCINNIDKSQQIKPKNKTVKMILIEDKRLEIKKMLSNKDKQKSKGFISQYIKAACFNGENGINIFNIKEVKLYQLIMACQKMNDLMGYKFLMNGIYAGTIDGKKFKDENLNWMS